VKRGEIPLLYGLDEIDLRIVAVLQEEASIENQELARRKRKILTEETKPNADARAAGATSMIH
jgi:hypothetical protein